MSIEAMSTVLSYNVGDSTRKLILLGYANHAHKDGTAAFPAKKTIAEYANCDPKTVQRHLRKLEEDGWIRRGDQALVSHVRADRRPVVYDVAMSDEQRTRWATSRGDNLPPRDNDNGGTSETPRGDTAVSPKPSKNQYPLTPASGGTGCARHNNPVPNCRGCGTTNRQLAAQQRVDAAQARRDANAAAAAADRAKPRGTKPAAAPHRTAARAAIAQARRPAPAGDPR